MASLSASLTRFDANVLPFNKKMNSLATELTAHSTTEANWSPPTERDAVRLDLAAVDRLPKPERMECRNPMSAMCRSAGERVPRSG